MLLSSFSVVHLLLGIQSTLKIVPSVRLSWRKKKLISKWLSVGDGFWVKDRAYVCYSLQL